MPKHTTPHPLHSGRPLPDRPDINLRVATATLDIVYEALVELIEIIQQNQAAAPETTAAIQLLVQIIAHAVGRLIS